MGKNNSHTIGDKATIRIAHIAGGLTSGGVEGVIYNYFSSLKDKSDYELVYISYDTPDEVAKKKFEDIGFTVYGVTKKYDNFFKSCQEVAQIFKKHKINIVHSHMTLMSFVTSMIGQYCGIKVRIAHSHLAQYPTGIKRAVYAVFKLLTRMSSNYLFACGKQAGEYLYGKRKMENSQVVVLNNAIPHEKYTFDPTLKEEIRKRYSIGDKLCIGHIGRFAEQKNHSFLIDIFNEIHKQNSDVMLLSLGDGPLMEEIKAKVSRLGLDENVVFAGSVENANECYSAMDIMLLPSLYEGLAVVLVESQFAGLPILLSDTVTKEIDIAGNLNYMSLDDGAQKWASASLKLLDNPTRVDSINKMKKAGYDVHTEALKLDEFYRKALNK